MTKHDDPDRAAILARRKHFVARALDGLADAPLAGPRTKLMAVAVSGLTTACPCLNVYVPPEETSDSGETGETGETGGTGTEDTGDTGTGDTGTEDTGTSG